MFGTIVMLAVGILIAATGVAIISAILRNLKQSQEFRRRLAERLEKLMLRRALATFKVDSTTYLHTRPVAEIEEHMRKCAACPETERCDDSLSAKPPTDLSFCPNYGNLEHVSRSAADQAVRHA